MRNKWSYSDQKEKKMDGMKSLKKGRMEGVTGIWQTG